MTKIDTYAVRINTADDEVIKIVDVIGLLTHVPDETPVLFIDLVGNSINDVGDIDDHKIRFDTSFSSITIGTIRKVLDNQLLNAETIDNVVNWIGPGGLVNRISGVSVNHDVINNVVTLLFLMHF